MPITGAWLYTMLSVTLVSGLSLTALAGGAASLVVGAHFISYTYAALPLTAGGFIYIAGSDLVPELHEECHPARSLLQLVFISLGIAIMSLLLLLG